MKNAFLDSGQKAVKDSLNLKINNSGFEKTLLKR